MGIIQAYIGCVRKRGKEGWARKEGKGEGIKRGKKGSIRKPW